MVQPATRADQPAPTGVAPGRKKAVAIEDEVSRTLQSASVMPLCSKMAVSGFVRTLVLSANSLPVLRMQT
jgi:hypothetical protein